MSFTVTDAFVQQFSGNVSFLAQQSRSRLRGKVLEDTIKGDSGYLEQLAPTAARKRTARHGDSPIANQQHLRRRIATYGYEIGDLIDKEDEQRLLIDPASAYTRNLSAAQRRSQDDEIIGAAFSTAYTGHSGATAITWPNGNSESSPTTPAGTQVAVNSWAYGNGSGNAGLTISKLLEAQVALDAAEGDDDDGTPEERFILVTAKDKGQLLSTTEATSADYNTVRALYDGKIDRFCGFTFIHSERVLLNSSSQRRLLAWRKSGLGFGITTELWGRVAERPDKSFSLYAYTAQTIGAARVEEAKVVEVICV